MKTGLLIAKQSNMRKIGAIMLISLFLIAGYMLTRTADAETSVVLPNSDELTNWNRCNNGTCTNDHYTYVDEDVLSPNDNDYVGTGTGTISPATAELALGLTAIPNVDTVTSVQVDVRARIQSIGGGAADTLSINLYIGGIQSATTVTPSFSAYGNHTATFNGSWTQAQLDGAYVYLTRNSLGSGNPTFYPDDMRISAISARVNYTSTVSLTQSNYRWYNNADSSSPGSPLAAQDIAATIAAGTPFRLRQLVDVSDDDMTAGYNFYLQYGEKISTCSAATYRAAYPRPTPTDSDFDNPSDVSVDSSYGTENWVVPAQAEGASDNSYAHSFNSAFGTTKETRYLKSTSYGFNIPADSVITGISVGVEGYSTGTPRPQPVVKLVKDDEVLSSSVSGVGAFTGSDTTVVFGGQTELWGETWTAADINATDFGAAVHATLDYSHYIYVDSIVVTVYYAPPDPLDVIQYFDNPNASSPIVPGSASDPVPSSGSVIGQYYTETEPFDVRATVDSGDSALWDFALTSSAAADGNTYCFRVVDANGDPLYGGYDYYPEITFGSGGGNGPHDPPTLDQSTRGGGGVVNGVKKNLSW